MREALLKTIAAASLACISAERPTMAETATAPPGGRADARSDRASSDPQAEAEAILWDRLRDGGRPDELDAFLVLFPNSRFRVDIQRRRAEPATSAPGPLLSKQAQVQPPRQPERAPPNLAAAAGAAAVAPDCGLIAAASDAVSVNLVGVLRRGQERQVRGMLDAFGVPAEAARLRLDPFEGPYCRVLAAVLMNTSLPPPDAPPRVTLQGTRPLVGGERLRVRVETPEWPAHLNVFFLTVSGEAASLVIDSQPRLPKTDLMLEDQRWRIAAPFGTDMLLVIASETPLFDLRRPSIERIEDFASALDAALRNSQRAATRIAARAIVVETAAR